MIRLRSICVGLFALALLAGCHPANRHYTDSRSAMLAASRQNDPHFPRTDATELITFAHIGQVESTHGVLHVVEVRWRLTGMPAPRGYTKISFFTPEYAYVGSQRCGRAYPMICRGPYVLMWGSEFAGDQVGNAWDLRDGFPSRRLIELEQGFGTEEE